MKERYRHKTMTLDPDEFIQHFLLHVLPSGFHRIRLYGLITSTTRKDNLALARAPLHIALLSTMTEWLRPAASSFEALHGIGPKRLLHPKAVIAITFTVNNSERPLIRVARIWLVSGLLGGERLRDVAA